VYVNGPRLLPAATLAAGRAAPILFHVHYPILQAAAARLAGWCVRRSGADVVACSSSARESLAPYIDSAKVHVIRNGTRDFGLRERTFDRRSWRIGLVGRISPQKGQVEFLEAAKLLAAQFPATRFVICGAPLFGAEEYLAQVKALALELPVDFLGWREDIASVLGDLDLLVMPSKEEGTPLVLLEAFSAGVPVVAFPAGGIREVMIDRETGFLVEPATSEALARRIGELMAGDPAVLKQVAGQARRVWEQSHTLDGYHNRITKLMEETASAWRAKHETTAPRERK
jgi:glycosyltransferase involved in cell wall biosynthesis